MTATGDPAYMKTQHHWPAILLALAMAAGQQVARGHEHVSVVAFATDARFAPFEKTAQARAEELLTDAGYEVLDSEKASQLRKGWVDLADPSHVVTAEEFASKAGAYDVSKVVRLAVTASSNNVFGALFTASASVGWRVIDARARVVSQQSTSMGTRGFPPSDGLTEGAAVVNAVLRAVDQAAEHAGLRVVAPTAPRNVPIRLEPATAIPGDLSVDYSHNVEQDAPWLVAAPLHNVGNEREEAACVSVSPDGQVGARGGYTISAERSLGGMRHLYYGGRVHLVDIGEPREFNVYTVHETGNRGAGENGTSAPLACRFLGDWRYLLVVTGNKAGCYDVERGVETCSFPIAEGPKSARIGIAHTPTADYVLVDLDHGHTLSFRVVAGIGGASPSSERR
jgi:hypothetical protein